MAITIISTPQQYTPAYNEQVFLVSGTNTAYNNYKYVFDIYDYSGTSRLIPQSIKIPARPSDGWCTFDAGRIIENFVNSDIALQTVGNDGWKTNDNSYKAYVIKVGEEFDVSTSGVTTYPDLATSSGTIYAWNAVYDFPDFQNYLQADRLPNVSGTPQLLTNQGVYDPVNVWYAARINTNENAWLYMLSGASNEVYTIDLRVTDTSNNTEQYLINNPFTTIGSTTSQRRFLRFPTGTKNLNFIPNSLIATGVQPIITATTMYYSVSVLNSTNNVMFRRLYYMVEDNVVNNYSTNLPVSAQDKYTRYRLHFLNKLGGYDSFTFSMPHTKKIDIERKTFKKNFGTSSSYYGYNSYDRGLIDFSTKIKDKLTLMSNWIHETEAVWLEELFTSPDVYIETNDKLYGVNITSSNYETKYALKDKLVNITIDVEYSYNRYRQRF